MAGGIFVDRPFSFNIKCVIFGLTLVAFYWLATQGKFNPWIVPLIFIVAYIAMAWYDEIYNCEDRLRSGTNSPVAMVDSIFKPQLRDICRAPAMPLFMYISFGKGGVYALAFGLALLGFIYHGYALYLMWK